MVGRAACGYCPGVSSWGHVEVAHVSHVLPDGRTLLDDVSFRIGEGTTAALVGPNGAGKTTLLRLVAGDLQPQEGSVTSTGGLGVMRQFIGTDQSQGITPMVRDLLLSVSPPRIQEAAKRLDEGELAMMERDDERAQLRYAAALAEWGEAGGYDAEVHWDACTVAAFGIPYDQCRWRDVGTLSGGEQKRLVLESLLRGNDGVLLLDEPDNYLDVPGKRWLEQQLASTSKTVLLVSHDRELLAACAQRIVTVEDRHVWVHGGGFGNYAQARADRISRLEELRRRWDEEHEKLKELVRTLRQKASYNDGMASRYQAAVTRLRRFEDEGPPQEAPREQNVKMRLRGGRTGKRAVMCENLVLTGNTNSFGTEIWFDDRVAILGGNGSGKSSFLRLLAGEEVPHEGQARLGARVVPGFFAQTHVRPDLLGKTLLEILHRGDAHRNGMGREQAARALDRYGLARAGEQTFDTLSGGQQARMQILLLELSGATLMLLDEPTDNLDLHSAEALEIALDAFAGTVIAVTHDRAFARTFDSFLIFGDDGGVRQSDEPDWAVGRVRRER